jgi:hypothetical protein
MPADAHVPKDARGRLALRYERRRAQDALERDTLGVALGESAQQVLGVEDPDDVVHRVAMHRVARVSILPDLLEHVRDRRGYLEGRGAGARDHHVTSRHVAELQHVADDFGLLVIQGAGHLALRHDELDLVFGHGRRRLGLHAQEPARHLLAEPQRQERERREEDFHRLKDLEQERRGAFGSTAGGGFDGLCRQRVAEHGGERCEHRQPGTEPGGEVSGNEHRREGDPDGPHDEPARFDGGAAIDVALERSPGAPFE